MACGGNNCKQSGQAGTAPPWGKWVWRGDCGGKALGLYSELAIDPWMLGHDMRRSWRLPYGCAATASQPLSPNPITWVYWLFYWRWWGLMRTRAAHFIKDYRRRDDTSCQCQEQGSVQLCKAPEIKPHATWGREDEHKMLTWVHLEWNDATSVALECRLSAVCRKSCSY